MSKRPELDLVNPPGQQVNRPEWPESKRGTLGEYIDKTLKHEAMLDRMNKKKLSFDEWYDSRLNYWVAQYCPNRETTELIWKAAQENAPSPKAPGA